MILFTILLFTLLALAAIVLTITGVLGTGIVVVFGDVIVFVLIIVGLVALFKGKKK